MHRRENSASFRTLVIFLGKWLKRLWLSMGNPPPPLQAYKAYLCLAMIKRPESVRIRLTPSHSSPLPCPHPVSNILHFPRISLCSFTVSTVTVSRLKILFRKRERDNGVFNICCPSEILYELKVEEIVPDWKFSYFIDNKILTICFTSTKIN